METALVESRAGDDVDIARNRLTDHVGGHRLAHDDLLGDRRGDRIEAGGAAFGADDVDAVERQRRPALWRAAQVDIAGLTLVALDTDTGQAADRLRDILVGQAADRVRGDDRDEGGAVALDFQRGGFGFGDRMAAAHDDFLLDIRGRGRIGEGRHIGDRFGQRRRRHEGDSRQQRAHHDGPRGPRKHSNHVQSPLIGKR